MLPAPGMIIVRACTLNTSHKDGDVPMQGWEIPIGKFPLGMSHQSLVPKMRARVGERAVPMVQNDIARKMAAFLQQKFPFQFQILIYISQESGYVK